MICFCPKHGHFEIRADELSPDRRVEDECPKCMAEAVQQKTERVIVVGGQDLAKYRDYSALVGLEIKDGHARIKGWKIWPHVDYQVVMDDTAKIYRESKMRLLGVDKGAAGEPVIEMYRSRGIRTEGVGFSVTTKQEMVNYARALRQGPDPILQLPPKGVMDELDVQLAEQELIIRNSPTVQYRHPESRHDDLLWSLLIALYVSQRWLTIKGGWIKPAEELAK